MISKTNLKISFTPTNQIKPNNNGNYNVSGFSPSIPISLSSKELLEDNSIIESRRYLMNIGMGADKLSLDNIKETLPKEMYEEMQNSIKRYHPNATVNEINTTILNTLLYNK